MYSSGLAGGILDGVGSQGDLLTYLNVFHGFVRSSQSPRWCHKHCINFQAMVTHHPPTNPSPTISRRVGPTGWGGVVGGWGSEARGRSAQSAAPSPSEDAAAAHIRPHQHTGEKGGGGR